MVTDLVNMLEPDTASNNKEIFEMLKDYVNNANDAHLSKNTQYTAKGLKTMIGLELIYAILKEEYGHDSITLKTLKKSIKINSISLDRKGREEIVGILKAIAGQEAEIEKRRLSRFNKILGVGNR